MLDEPSNSRHPVFSGSFYPERKEAVMQQLKDFEKQTRQLNREVSQPKDCAQLHGIIVPHAGYIYSGKTAFLAHQLLKKCAPEKIVLLGPSHRALFQGAVSDGYSSWLSPIGDTSIINDPFFSEQTDIQASEHSLEVQLPFIQYFCPKASLLPLVIGNLPDALVSEYAEYLFQQKYFLIISSDLSHYHSLEEANRRDKISIEQIEKLDIQQVEACGINPLRIGMSYMKKANTKPHLIHYSTSAEVFGDTDSVVGYASFWF